MAHVALFPFHYTISTEYQLGAEILGLNLKWSFERDKFACISKGILNSISIPWIFSEFYVTMVHAHPQIFGNFILQR